MAQVELGDWLLTEKGYYTQIVGWLHKDEYSISTNFMAITYADGNSTKTLTTTRTHHVRSSSGELVEAQDMKTGTELKGADGTARKVVGVEYLDSLVGQYAPLTRSGTATVDGIQCSNYINGPQFEWFMHLCTWPWRSGWLVQEDTDLYTALGRIPGFYLNSVRWLRTSSVVI